MQREHIRRGFSIHQKVVLEIDFSGRLWGYTEIMVVPETKELRALHLHCRQCTVHSVTVGSHSAEFVHHDPLSSLHTSKSEDCHTHPELKRKLFSALAEGDEGELSIGIPKDTVIKPSGNTAIGVASEAATPEPQTPGFPAQPPPPVFEFSPITVTITYSLNKSGDGVQFVLPTDAYPYRIPHVFTTPIGPDSARCWVPCIDNLWERCTWEFEFIAPRQLAEREDGTRLTADDEPRDGDYPTVVVCSGEFIEQVSHPHNSGKTIFIFAQSTPASVQHIAWAAGPFHVLQIPTDLSTAEDMSGSSQPLMHAFCLPGQEEQLAETVSQMRSAMSFYSSEFGSYPYSSHKLVFVDEMPTQRFDAVTLSLVTIDLLYGKDGIDQVYETRLALSHALACQWIGINIHQKTWSDTWLVNGLGLHITGLFMRKLFGNNEYRFRLKKDMERTIALDNGEMPPICQPQILDPPDPTILAFINLKAPLVLHILDRRLGKSGTSLGLSRVLPKLFLSAISGEMPNNALSTHAFLRTCRKVSGIDPRSFAEQWIYGSGCPTFKFTASFNRKKMAVEISMTQESPAYKTHEKSDLMKLLFKPVPLFEGQMTIRIHEADGTPYEHVLDIRNQYKRYEVPFNTKYKRVRRNTKRYLARQAAAQAAAEGDAEAAAAMDMVDMGFGLEIWEKEKERENWKVADWTEEDEQQMAGQTYEWIRIDADFEWIASISFDQKDYMWVSQLQRDRDVVAQYEAITVLMKQPTAIISSTLTKTVLVTNYFFRIRCEAALALVTCAISRLDWIGLFHLFKLFLRYCYDPEDPGQDLFTHTYVPRPNDFSDIAEYFVRKSLLQAVSRVRFDNGKTPAVVRQFLIDQLRYNDNTLNHYSDALYICTAISALACASMSTVPPERGEFVATEARPVIDPQDAELLRQSLIEVRRYRNMDRLIPSHHNVVTIATIEFNLILSLANIVPHEAAELIPLTREGHYLQVRLAAFEALFFTKWYSPKIMRYILAVMAHDTSRVIRRAVARWACHSLPLFNAMGELKDPVKKAKSLLVEEDGGTQESKKEPKKGDDMQRALRKNEELGKNEVFRKSILPIVMASDADQEVRWCLLKLADLLIKGADEAPPSITIHLPPTPVIESAPPVPSIKPPKPQRTLSIKAAIPPTKSPLTPYAVPPKLKIPINGARADASARTPSSAAPLVENRRPPTNAHPVPALPPKKAVTKQPKPALKVSSGMNRDDLIVCQNALRKLKTHKNGPLFLQPVDPVRDGAPNYFQIIKNPMDLGTMEEKVKQRKYKDRFAFEQDFRLMIANAKLYNLPGSYAHSHALGLEKFFNELWTRINKTLEARSQREPPPAPPAPATSSVKISAGRSKLTPSEQATPPPASSTPGRPTIKLKLGATKLNGASPSISHASSPVVEAPIPTPKIKVKPPSVPKPRRSRTGYFSEDDADADLLEEVIAIEREKDQERRQASIEKGKEKERDKEREHREREEKEREERERARERERERERAREKEKEREREREREREATAQRESQSMPKLIIGKRKKPAPSLDRGEEDDELLALATRAKRERSAASSPTPGAGPSNQVSEKIGTKVSPSGTPAPAPVKNGVSKSDKPKEKGKVGTSISAPKISIKGKEREVASPALQASAAKTKKSAPVQAETPVNEKKCRDVLKTLTKLREAALFLQPVDVVRDGCPTYYDEIKNPMDFGTMSKKLTNGEYKSMEEFAKDVGLIFNNCRTFNPPNTAPSICADVVEAAWKTAWAKALEKKLAYNDKRSLLSILSKLLNDPISWVFREPVDPIALGIPTYFDIIPRKNARDLRTIRQKLEADKYDSVEAFEADLDLMIDNAITFNGTDSEVGQVALLLRDKCKDMLSPLRSSGPTKRKNGEKGTPQPTKKVRLA